ncbi:MAG TPA: hypothetical protein VHC01_03045 [Gaiellaceae bacterium]|jgi:hypothetical protein|nr:hypothetical protein [Gaiellaceae bacterium]
MAASDLHLSAFDAWLWRLAPDELAQLGVRDVARAAAEALVGTLPQLTFLSVIAEDEPAGDVLRRRAIALVDSHVAGNHAVLLSTYGQGHYVVAVFPSDEAGVYHLVGSAPVTDARWRRVEDSWLKAAAPKLAPVILNKADFEAIGDALAEHGQVAVSRMTARVLHDQSSYSRGWPIRRPSHRVALREAQDMLVRTLTMSVDSLSIHVRRHAGATFYHGDYSLFCSVVLHRLAQAAGARRMLLSDRDRQRAEPLRESIVMRLPEGTFLADGANKELINSVDSVRGVQVAVFHANPYLHFTVTDYLDGSNFDVFVTEDDRVTILPGYRASVGSLARVTDSIGDALGMIELRTERIDAPIPDSEFIGAA